MYSSISCLQTVRNHHDPPPIIHKYTALSENWIPQKPVVYHRLSCQTGHLGGRPNFQTHPCPINIQKFPLFHRYIDLIKFHQTSHQSPLNYIKYLYQTAAKLHLWPFPRHFITLLSRCAAVEAGRPGARYLRAAWQKIFDAWSNLQLEPP